MELYKDDIDVYHHVSTQAETSHRFLKLFYIFLIVSVIAIVIYAYNVGDISFVKLAENRKGGFFVMLLAIAILVLIVINFLIGMPLAFMFVAYMTTSFKINEHFYTYFIYYEYVSFAGVALVALYALKSLYVAKKEFNTSLMQILPIFGLVIVLFSIALYKSIFLLEHQVGFLVWIYIQLAGMLAVALSFYYTNLFLVAQTYVSSIVTVLRLKYIFFILLSLIGIYVFQQFYESIDIFQTINLLLSNPQEGFSPIRDSSITNLDISAFVVLFFISFLSIYFMFDSYITLDYNNIYTDMTWSIVFFIILTFSLTLPMFALIFKWQYTMYLINFSLVTLILAIFIRNIYKQDINIMVLIVIYLLMVTKHISNISSFTDVLGLIAQTLSFVVTLFIVRFISVIFLRIFLRLYHSKIMLFIVFLFSFALVVGVSTLRNVKKIHPDAFFENPSLIINKDFFGFKKVLN